MTSRAVQNNQSVERIYWKDLFQHETPAPSLAPIFSEKVPAREAKDSPSLMQRVKQIPSCVLNFFKDDEWMAFLSDLFSGISHMCSLTGTRAAEFVPYLSIASAPFTLYHALNETLECFKLTNCAFKTCRVVEFFFWAAKGLGATGTTLGDIIKPFAGGMTIFGLTQIPAIGFTFTYVFPALLIALSAFGGTTQWWSLVRSAYTLHTFKSRESSLGGSLIKLESFLHDLQKPQQKGNTPLAHAHALLDKKYYSQRYFSSSEQENALNRRIEAFMQFNDPYQMEAARKTLERLIPAIERGVGIDIRVIDSNDSLFQQLEVTLDVCNQVLSLARSWKGKDPIVSLAILELEMRHEELVKLKETLYQEGIEMTEAIRREISFNLAQINVSVVSSAVSLAAGILFLLFQQHQTTAYFLALGGSCVGLVKVLANKIQGPNVYPQSEGFLELLRQKEIMDARYGQVVKRVGRVSASKNT